MATRANMVLVDGFGLKRRLGLDSLKTANVQDGDIITVVNKIMEMTRMGLFRVTRTDDLSPLFTTVSRAPAEITRELLYKIFYEKSKVVGSGKGGEWALTIPELKPALVDTSGRILIDNQLWTDFAEFISDGTGLLGTQGLWTISDGEQVPEPFLGYSPVLRGGLASLFE